MRRAKLGAFVRKAVSIGVPIGSLTSFQELLAPDLVERVIDAYWQDNGEEPSVYTIELVLSCWISPGKPAVSMKQRLPVSRTCASCWRSIDRKVSPRRTWR